jgi:hypothetical protein
VKLVSSDFNIFAIDHGDLYVLSQLKILIGKNLIQGTFNHKILRDHKYKFDFLTFAIAFYGPHLRFLKVVNILSQILAGN